MVHFNPVTTQTWVWPSGERHDWGTSHSMNFFAPPSPIKADATAVGCPLHLKMNPPLKMSLPFIEI